MFDVKIRSAERKIAGLSLRDAHKRRTSNLLRRTAMRMFLAEGYDATKAEDIAEKAGVSVRTFFRYFATKDEVVFKGQGAWAKTVAASYMRQPADMPELDAICEALIAAEGEMDLKSAQAYVRIVENSQMLRGRASELMRNSLQEITCVVSKRRGLDEPDAEARLFGEVAFAVYQAALKDWRDDRFTGTLEAAVRERFQMVQAIVGGAAGK